MTEAELDYKYLKCPNRVEVMDAKELVRAHSVTLGVVSTRLENLHVDLMNHNTRIQDYINNAVTKQDLKDVEDKILVNSIKLDELDTIVQSAKNVWKSLTWIAIVIFSVLTAIPAIIQLVEWYQKLKV
jgi:hypothetical protein